jgi:hypothetical protein
MIKARAKACDECAQVNFLRDSRLIALFPNADTKMDTPSYMTGWEDAIVNHIFYFCMPRSFLLASKHTRAVAFAPKVNNADVCFMAAASPLCKSAGGYFD